MALNLEFTSHAKAMVQERRIAEEWIERTIETGARKLEKDGNWHYTKPIAERDNRVLRVVVNADANPPRIVTLFFDRRLREQAGKP